MDYSDKIRKILKSPVMIYSNRPVLYSRLSNCKTNEELEILYYDVKSLYERIGYEISNRF